MQLGSDPPDRLKLNPLERAVVRASAARLGEAGRGLEAQLAGASVVSRSHSGVGFVTRLRVPPEADALPPALAGELRPVRAAHPALHEPAEFLLQIRDGYLASIEAFCHEGTWPEDDAQFRVAG